MGEQAYLRPTALQKIRAFFHDVGEPVPPWTGFDEIMDHLYMVFYSRREDDAFWKSAEKLIESLGKGRTGGRGEGLPDPQAEILAGERIDAIVAGLQASVKTSRRRPGRGVMKKFVQGLSAPLMGCVLMMGAAFASGCETEESDVTKQLDRYVDDSNLPAGDKDALKSCFAGWTESRKQDLVDLFKDQAPEEIAAVLEDLLARGGGCTSAPGDADVAADAPSDAAQDVQQEEAPPDTFYEPVPIYKGVDF
jgi:hypothetical protein